MIYLDTICANADRHTKNYGVLRDTATEQFLGLAPIFDNNIALISRGYTTTLLSEKHILVSMFKDFILNNELARSYYEEIDQDFITEELLNELIGRTGFDVDKQKVIDFVLSGVSVIQNLLASQQKKNDNDFGISLS